MAVRLQCSQLDKPLRIVYAFNKYMRRVPMPRAAVDDNKRMNLRLQPGTKGHAHARGGVEEAYEPDGLCSATSFAGVLETRP